MKSIKILGLATAMALALIAFVGASSASANSFKVWTEPATWSGSLTGKSHVLRLEEESFTCSKVSFVGETIIKTLEEVTVTPELSGCTHFGLGATWAMHGCKFSFHPGAGPGLTGAMDIVGCESPMSYEGEGCRIEIGNQKGLGSVTYVNVAGEVPTIKAIANLSGITYTRSNGGLCGGGPTGTFHDGTYTGEWIVKGSTKPGGAPVGVEVESTSPPPFSKFAAEEGPVTITGSSTGSAKRLSPLGGNGLICSSYMLSGTSSSITPETLTLVPTYKGCQVGTETVPDSNISAGNCSYIFHANGKFDIGGEKCASNPISIARAGCVATIGPQSGLSGITFTNEGSGKLRTVSMSGTLKEIITYTLTGASCIQQGTFSTGYFQAATKLSATNSGGVAQGLSIE